jgi:hypothetical protein
MAFFAHTIAKVFSKIFIGKKDLKVAILNGNIAGELVDQMIEIQPWNRRRSCSLIFRALLFFDHNQMQLEGKIV